jgi:transcription elongation GreA/GreB family factor
VGQAAAGPRLLTRLIDRAVIAEDEPEAPAVAELGKAVTVHDGEGVVWRFLIVHPVEAPLTTHGSPSAHGWPR